MIIQVWWFVVYQVKEAVFPSLLPPGSARRGAGCSTGAQSCSLHYDTSAALKITTITTTHLRTPHLTPSASHLPPTFLRLPSPACVVPLRHQGAGLCSRDAQAYSLRYDTTASLHSTTTTTTHPPTCSLIPSASHLLPLPPPPPPASPPLPPLPCLRTPLATPGVRLCSRDAQPCSLRCDTSAFLRSTSTTTTHPPTPSLLTPASCFPSPASCAAPAMPGVGLGAGDVRVRHGGVDVGSQKCGPVRPPRCPAAL